MKSAYRVLAYLIALEVVIQAASIAFAAFGLFKWVEDGGVLDKATMEDGTTTFTGVVGFMIHGMNGTMLIPLLALILLIVSFFAKIPGGVKWAGFVLLAVVIQVLLGMFAHGAPALGALHGLNAFILFGVAMMAAQRVKMPATAASAKEHELV